MRMGEEGCQQCEILIFWAHTKAQLKMSVTRQQRCLHSVNFKI